jgi:predicted amidophosphoribosyltransferase
MLCSMSLFPCPSCKQSVSKKAKSCPHCGHAFKPDNQMSLTDPVHLIGAIIAALFTTALIFTIIEMF